jgi:peroxiredoxin Q/BCP
MVDERVIVGGMLSLPRSEWQRHVSRLWSAAVADCRASAWALEEGDHAPDFELRATDGKTYRLRDFIGRSPLVLAWYPQALTCGCTLECKSFTENGHLIRAYDVPYFMVSVDPLEENARFALAMNADFPLLSDPTKDAARAYGVLHQERFAFRTTFYIDQSGTILRIDRNVDPETAAQDVARNLAELGFEHRDGTPD